MSAKNNSSSLPRIAYIGGESLSLTHGTGFMFQKHFARYPRSKILDVNCQRTGTSQFRAINFERMWTGSPEWISGWQKVVNEAIRTGKTPDGLSLIYFNNYAYTSAQIDWDRFGGPPDLIYSTCHSFHYFSFLHHVYRSLPKKVPILQHFLDLDTKDFSHFLELWKELQPNICDVWALTSQIRRKISTFSDRPVKLVQALHQPETVSAKDAHRGFGPNFRTVIVGNVWTPDAYEALCRLWGDLRKEITDLRKLEWYGQPRRLSQHGLKSGVKSTIFEDKGYVSAQTLKSRLNSADLAIVAFTGNEKVGRCDYAKYSLPSRLGDYCAAGLPIVVISRPGTEISSYVREHKIGITLDPANPRWAKEVLHSFIMDQNMRAKYAKRARLLALREFNLEKYQNHLHDQLIRLSQP